MESATEIRDVGKRRPRPDKTERKDEPVRIDSEVLRIARIVASYEEKSLADYISDTLRPIVDRDHSRHIKRYSGGKDSSGER